MKYSEVNFDGLVGPNHNYAGLAEGNLASAKNSKNTSYPKKAALQGLEKMRLLSGMGLTQAVIPPQERPDIKYLEKLGFEGSEQQLIDKAGKSEPQLLAAVYSASSMWTANCATVSPSSDTKDARVHITPANLASNFHRSIESRSSFNYLNRIFSNKDYFKIHHPLPSCEEFSDEGAANHIRFCSEHSKAGLELFVFGKGKGFPFSKRFRARQDVNACKTLVKMHGLDSEKTVLAMQSLKAVDAGVFHNDVISTGNEDLYILHEYTFQDQESVKKELQSKFRELTGKEMIMAEISHKELSMTDAINSYLFNTQIVTLPDNSMVMIAPLECKEIKSADRAIKKIINGPSRLEKVIHVNLRESMQNGGGPACLRLRASLSEEEQKYMHRGVLFSQELDDRLVDWVNRHYRDELSPIDLLDFSLVNEIRTALDELTQILGLGSLYDFQK